MLLEPIYSRDMFLFNITSNAVITLGLDGLSKNEIKTFLHQYISEHEK